MQKGISETKTIYDTKISSRINISHFGLRRLGLWFGGEAILGGILSIVFGFLCSRKGKEEI